MTPEAQRELAALLRSLSSLVVDVAKALGDGLVTVDELVTIGADVPDLVAAISALARPNEPSERMARHRAARQARDEARALLRRARRDRRLRESRRVVRG